MRGRPGRRSAAERTEAVLELLSGKSSVDQLARRFGVRATTVESWRDQALERIACWFIDTDYNEESFFVRHAYFLGANDPYKSLNSDTSRPFAASPESGRIAVKVINHLGDEVMKVFRGPITSNR